MARSLCVFELTCMLALFAWYSAAAPVRGSVSLRSFRRERRVNNDAVWSVGCLKESWFPQRLDHFYQPRDIAEATFNQRYFICDKFWSQAPGGQRGPIFFYAGNEADVTTYVNATGLMWENAEEFGALLVFAEHRYYGKTQPFGPKSWALDPSYLTVEQALGDYANLLWHLRRELGAEDSPVIAFGGSYGGMLAAWLRVKYPHIVAGAVAASAPMGAFPGVPGWEPSRFWEVVTYDATASAGSVPECSANVRAAFAHVLKLGDTPEGRGTLQRLLRLCDTLPDPQAALTVAYWLQGAFDAFAMGNYPFPSTYISGDPDHPLPAWPMRAACTHMAGRALRPTDLVQALREAVGVLYNATGQVDCYSTDAIGPAAGSSGPWDYQWCTELDAQELPYYPTNGRTDMFWDQGPFNLDAITAHCQAAWGVVPRQHWSVVTYGGLDYHYASNIVFSNGLYDPWSAYGVLLNMSDSVVAVIIPDGAHHVDLMYSTPADPPSLRAARRTEMQLVRTWVEKHMELTRAAASAVRLQPSDRFWAAAHVAAGDSGGQGSRAEPDAQLWRQR